MNDNNDKPDHQVDFSRETEERRTEQEQNSTKPTSEVGEELADKTKELSHTVDDATRNETQQSVEKLKEIIDAVKAEDSR